MRLPYPHRRVVGTRRPILLRLFAFSLGLLALTSRPAPAQEAAYPTNPGYAGKLRVSGLLQAWYGTGFGDPLSGNTSLANSPTPPGRNYGGGRGDLFRFRRAELALDGGFTRRLNYHVLFDVANNGLSAGNALQELTIGYQPGPHWRIEFGKQLTGLSEEGTRSSAELLTVARSIMDEDLPATVGRVGYIRDTGLVLRYQSRPVKAFIGIWNDNGAARDGRNGDHSRFLDGAFFFAASRHLTIGLWGGTNISSDTPAETRDRAGGTLLYRAGPHFVEFEIAYTRDYAAGAPAPGANGSLGRGAYLLYAHALSRKWQLVARYDNWDPAHQGTSTLQSVTTETGVVIPPINHKLIEYTLGVNYYLRGNNAKIQMNYIREDAETNAGVFFGKQRTVLLINFQVAF